MALLLVGSIATARADEPSSETLRSLVEGYAQAIETNNRELALWYVHPDSPQRSELDEALRGQLSAYLERAHTTNLDGLRLSGETISAKVDQDIVRVFDMKIARDTRQSIYQFREFSGIWQIWGIDEVIAQPGMPPIHGLRVPDNQGEGRAESHSEMPICSTSSLEG